MNELNQKMQFLLDQKPVTQLEVEDLVEGTVISIQGSEVYINLGHLGTGIIYGREFMNARDILKNTTIGDTVKAKVVEKENENGYIELSLKEARQALIWGEVEKAMKSRTKLSIPVKEANKGGLIMVWQGIEGFLPASQLSVENYPRVPDGNKDEILRELKKLADKKLNVIILSANPKEGKLIFSEKDLGTEVERGSLATKYVVGDELDCEVTGVVDFGVFLKVEEGLEGLVHISELDWALVEDPRKMFKLGEKIKAKVIDVKEGKISLSIKALKPNPWKDAADKFKAGDIVSGVVIKYNKHGALVSIQEGVAGLVHVSDFGDEAKLRQNLELGRNYSFKINVFDPKDQRMTLSHQA